MKKLAPIIIGLFLFISCKKEQVCRCVVYNGMNQITSFSKMTFNSKERNAEKVCEEQSLGFSSNTGSYMDCNLEK